MTDSNSSTVVVAPSPDVPNPAPVASTPATGDAVQTLKDMALSPRRSPRKSKPPTKHAVPSPAKRTPRASPKKTGIGAAKATPTTTTTIKKAPAMAAKKKAAAGGSKKKATPAKKKEPVKKVAPKKKPAARKKAAPKKPKVDPALDPFIIYDKPTVQSLAALYPDKEDPESRPPLSFINKANPVRLLPVKLSHQGIVGMTFSPNGEVLATVGTNGIVRLWRTDNWAPLIDLYDSAEPQLEEYWCCEFSPDMTLLYVAGKLKDREVWNESENDNEVLPTAIKIFDLESGAVVGKLEGHIEEVQALKFVMFRNEPYLLSGGQDGYIFKWGLDKDYRTCTSKNSIDWDSSCMVSQLAFLPRCGNKYFLAAADNGIKVYDFEKGKALQEFNGLYTSYCDSLHVVNPIELETDSHFVITRGVELLTEEDGETKPQRTSRANMWKLSMPTTKDGEFVLDMVHTFEHENYLANLWLQKINTNGRYLFAPTSFGDVYVWNLRTAELVSILADMEAAVRSIKFHPSKPIMLCACDEDKVFIYDQPSPEEMEKIQEREQQELEQRKKAELATAKAKPTTKRRKRAPKTKQSSAPMDVVSSEPSSSTTTTTTTTSSSSSTSTTTTTSSSSSSSLSSLSSTSSPPSTSSSSSSSSAPSSSSSSSSSTLDSFFNPVSTSGSTTSNPSTTSTSSTSADTPIRTTEDAMDIDSQS
eukprot:TRINITY_DN2801_c4_g1_i1.p1 TRINITY_DN2801_c4_g1~~TRINITY_DN2801_c4_g1_i1.p1  ORF type:complete len:700 (+),score=184.83 TRINITY_DN2801_c4_g1_i1:275-2374(+)